MVFFGLGTWQLVRHQNRYELIKEREDKLPQIQEISRYSGTTVPEPLFVSEGCVLVGPKVSQVSLQKRGKSSAKIPFGYDFLKHFYYTLPNGQRQDCIVNIGWIPSDIIHDPKSMMELNQNATLWIKEKQLDLDYDGLDEKKRFFHDLENPKSFSSIRVDPSNDAILPIAIFRYKSISDMADLFSIKDHILCIKNTRYIDGSIITPSFSHSSRARHKIPHLEYMATWYVLSFITTLMLYFRK
jgi:hypothetical protein